MLIRANRTSEPLLFPMGRGLGGGKGKAGLGAEGVFEAALTSERATAGDTVRKIHTAVLDSSGGELSDDATVVCLSVT